MNDIVMLTISYYYKTVGDASLSILVNNLIILIYSIIHVN